MPRTLLAAVALALGASLTHAQWYTIARSLTNPVQRPITNVGTEFGWSVAALGGNLLVGSPRDDSAAADGGAVFLFDGATGGLVRTFHSPSPTANEFFGSSVAVVGTNVLVGTNNPLTTGAAYLFDGITGSLLKTFHSPTPTPGDAFGYAVAAVGANVLIGDPAANSGSTEAGAAYLFDGTTGALLRTFLNPTPTPYEGFGISVAGLGPNVLIGAYEDSIAAPGGGAAYLFDASSGALLKTFLKPGAAALDLFGWSVATLGPNVLVGAPGDDTGASDAGAVYLFDPTTPTPTLLKTFVSPSPGAKDQLGWSVAALGGTKVLAGAPQQLLTTATGFALLFDAASGAVLRTFSDPRPVAHENFGSSVTAVGDEAVVGAPYGEAAAGQNGVAHVFDVCGNGAVTPFEQCDDGNTSDGDGCSSTCRLELCGAAPAGGCVGVTPGKASLQLRNRDPDGRDVLGWKWRGAPVGVGNFGDPVGTAAYALCLYDASGATQPLASLAAPAGELCAGHPCWAPVGATGFQYKDKLLTPNGLLLLKLRAAALAQGKIALKGKGVNLGLPDLPLTPPVRVQLRNTGTSACWEAIYSTPTVNDSDLFKATSD